ncbi:hypothetical protein ABZ918_31610 [Streptomyces viridosporus]|nr:MULTISPECIES: hypothetical protein [Streptomyces]
MSGVLVAVPPSPVPAVARAAAAVVPERPTSRTSGTGVRRLPADGA